jgi:hypothetical protein
MQHLGGVVLQSLVDLLRVADFKKPHFGIALEGARFDRVQDGLQLVFEVQHRVRRLAFVGRSDGDEDFQRRSHRRPARSRRAGHPSANAHPRHQRRRATPACRATRMPMTVRAESGATAGNHGWPLRAYTVDFGVRTAGMSD